MRNLTSKTLWILFSDGGAKLFGFFVTIYLARVLGAEQYGLITLAISVMGICVWFSDLGIQTFATRAIAASGPDKQNPARFLWMKILLSLLVILLSSLLIWFLLAHEPTLRILIVLFIFSLLPRALQIDWYYKGVQEFRWVTLASWIQGATYLGALLLLVSADDLLLVPLIYCASLLAGALTLILCYRGEHSLTRSPEVSKWPDDIRSSFFLGLGHFMAQTIILLPPIAIGYYFSEAQIGFYGVAFKLILVVMLADRAFNTLLLPNLTKMWSERPDDVQPQLTIISKWMLFFGSLGTIALFFSAESIITLMFGERYSDAVPMLKILAFLLPVTFLNSVFSFGLISFGRDRSFMKSTLVGGLGAAILILLAGLSGSVLILIGFVVLAEVWITICIYYRFRSTMKLPIFVYLTSGVFILCGTIVAGSLLPVHSLLALSLSLLIFAATLIITGLLSRKDFQWLRRRITQ